MKRKQLALFLFGLAIPTVFMFLAPFSTLFFKLLNNSMPEVRDVIIFALTLTCLGFLWLEMLGNNQQLKRYFWFILPAVVLVILGASYVLVMNIQTSISTIDDPDVAITLTQAIVLTYMIIGPAVAGIVSLPKVIRCKLHFHDREASAA